MTATPKPPAAGLEAAARAAQQHIVDRCRHRAGDFEPVALATPDELPAYLARRAGAFAARLALRKGDESRVEPAEVEAALIDCPGVHAVTVAVRPDRTGDPRLVAYAVGGTPPPSPEALREELAARLPAYRIPQHFVLLDALPLTRNGKVDVHAWPPPPATRPALAAPCVDPRDPGEAVVAAIGREVLRVEPIGVRDAFLDLGGDSVAAMRIVTRLQASFGGELPASELLSDTETVEVMARVIAASLAMSPSEER